MAELLLSSPETRYSTIEGALDAPDGLECTVTLSRTQKGDCGQRQVFARIDDHPDVALVFGERITLDVTPGRHLLRANNTLFWKKVEFAIEPAEHLEFILINEARWWTAGIVGLLGAAPVFLRVKKISLK